MENNYPAASAVGSDIPDRPAVSERPQLLAGDASPALLIRVAIEKLRGPDGRGADRASSLAITKLEEALLWMGERLA